jgi:hypothetical protein
MSRPLRMYVHRLLLSWLVIFSARVAVAAEEDLQKKLANPVSDLIAVPFQYTGTFDVGPETGTQHTLNIQPVYPASLGAWNLINRLVVPFLSAPPAAPGQHRVSGLGDVVYEGFFSPAAPTGLIWAAGPLVMLNSSTDDRLGSGHTSLGPAIVTLRQSGPWSIGALITQAWSFAGDDRRPAISQFQLQPIVSYTLDPRHTIAFNGTMVANWHAHPASQVWTVPVGMTYSILTRRPGSVPTNFIFGGGCNIIRPAGGGDLFVRAQINLIFSKR